MIMRDPGASSRRVVSEALSALGLSLAPPLAEIGSTPAATEPAPTTTTLVLPIGHRRSCVKYPDPDLRSSLNRPQQSSR